MNTAAEITLPFADGEYLFALKGKQIEELQRVCDAPLGVITQRLITLRPTWQDVIHTIRLGLIGGGLDAVRAKELVETYVDGQPIAKPDQPSAPLAVAGAVISAVWFGLDEIEAPEGDTPAGKPGAGTGS